MAFILSLAELNYPLLTFLSSLGPLLIICFSYLMVSKAPIATYCSCRLCFLLSKEIALRLQASRDLFGRTMSAQIPSDPVCFLRLSIVPYCSSIRFCSTVPFLTIHSFYSVVMLTRSLLISTSSFTISFVTQAAITLRRICLRVFVVLQSH